MKLETRKKIGVVISIIAIFLAILHVVFPHLSIDAVTVLLLVVSIIPWLAPLFKSIELPSGLKIQYQDLKEKEKEIEKAGLLSSTVSHEIAHLFISPNTSDPNLVLAGLRIEVEKALRALAAKHQIDTDNSSINKLARDLAGKQIISANAYLALADLSRLLNQAVHGAEIDERAVEWALGVGPKIITALRNPVVNKDLNKYLK